MPKISEPIATSIVCKNALAREGLKRIINEEGFRVETSFPDAKTMLECRCEEAFDIVILDGEGLEHAEEIHREFSNTHMVFLSEAFDFEEMLDAFRVGVDGYILKHIDCASLVGSLRLIMLGEKVMPSELIDHLPKQTLMPNSACGQQAGLVNLLSERERETLRSLVLGYPNKVIAHQLDISEATVKVHVKAILRKLMVNNRTQAAIWAVNNGLAPAQLTCPDEGCDDSQIEEPTAHKHTGLKVGLLLSALWLIPGLQGFADVF